MAGRPVGLPVRRSKREPCSQHSTVASSTSPSDSGTSACEQTSWIAKTSPSVRTTQTGSSPNSTRTARPRPAQARSARRRRRSADARPSSSVALTRSSSRARSTRRVSRSATAGTPICSITSAKKPRTTSRRASIVRDAAGHQVEQLLVVEPAGRAGVPGAGDLAGLDLQVGHRVGAGAVGEQQVAVQLVGVGAHGLRPDPHVADPDRVRVLALQRALVRDAGLGSAAPRGRRSSRCSWCWPASAKDRPSSSASPPGRGEPHGRADPDQVAAEGDDHVPQPRVPAELRPRARRRAPRRRPSPARRRTVSVAPSPTRSSTLAAQRAPSRRGRGRPRPRRTAADVDDQVAVRRAALAAQRRS